MTEPSASSTSTTTLPVKNPSEDSSSIYFLGTHDYTGQSIVSEKFNGSNYIAWSKSIIMALSIKNKLSFIDGSLLQPTGNDASLLLHGYPPGWEGPKGKRKLAHSSPSEPPSSTKSPATADLALFEQFMAFKLAHEQSHTSSAGLDTTQHYASSAATGLHIQEDDWFC